jgi:hypothetical protein
MGMIQNKLQHLFIIIDFHLSTQKGFGSSVPFGILYYKDEKKKCADGIFCFKELVPNG